jgi:hypothetical protein
VTYSGFIPSTEMRMRDGVAVCAVALIANMTDAKNGKKDGCNTEG